MRSLCRVASVLLGLTLALVGSTDLRATGRGATTQVTLAIALESGAHATVDIEVERVLLDRFTQALSNDFDTATARACQAPRTTVATGQFMVAIGDRRLQTRTIAAKQTFTSEDLNALMERLGKTTLAKVRGDKDQLKLILNCQGNADACYSAGMDARYCCLQYCFCDTGSVWCAFVC